MIWIQRHSWIAKFTATRTGNNFFPLSKINSSKPGNFPWTNALRKKVIDCTAVKRRMKTYLHLDDPSVGVRLTVGNRSVVIQEYPATNRDRLFIELFNYFETIYFSIWEKVKRIDYTCMKFVYILQKDWREWGLVDLKKPKILVPK